MGFSSKGIFMDEFPSNTHSEKSKPEKKIERIVTGNVARRKKPLGTRFRELFFGGEDAQSVWNYIFVDVLVPAAKNTLYDAVTQATERSLYGEIRGARARAHGVQPSPFGKVSYDRYSSGSLRRPQDDPRPTLSKQARSAFDFDEIILDTRAEAEGVIGQLIEIISNYGATSVADLYSMIGITPEHTDNKWGWTDLRGASALKVRAGYLLDLPRPGVLE